MLKLFGIKKRESTKEMVLASQKLLLNFLNSCSDQKLEKYEEYVVPALTNLCKVVYEKCRLEYDGVDLLYKDYMLADIGLIAFLGENLAQEYIKTHEAKNLQYPDDDYEIIDATIGLCRDVKTEENFYNARIAIDSSITATASRWNENIPEIIALL